MGNYDDGVGFDRDECGCAYRDPIDRQLGDRSFAWTKAHVTHDNRAFLRTLHKETHPTRISAPPPQFPVILIARLRTGSLAPRFPSDFTRAI